MTLDAAALAPYGWDARVEARMASAVSEGLVPGGVPGRVVRVEKGGCFVRTPAGERLAVTDGAAAVGDWVLAADDGSTLVVAHVVDRWSALVRHDPETATRQVLAANVDLVLIVAPLDRLRLARLERELLLAWESGARPLVVLTKADIVRDAARAGRDVASRMTGVEVVVTSSVTGAGVDDVARALQPNRTAVLFGASGAGKSTLANALIGDDVLATGAVREGDKRGRHTTTSRQLVPLARGGVLIDTPGLRSLSIWQSEDGLAAVFGDLEEMATGCRFSDCRHDAEPGCAITQALQAGDVDAGRVTSYLKLLREVEDLDRTPRGRGPSGRRTNRRA